MSSYCTLQGARRQLETELSADNNILLGYLQSAAQTIDDITGYWFDERYLTLGFNGEVGSTNAILNLRDWPLRSVDTLTNGDGSIVAPANYALLPYGQYPKTGIRLNQGNFWLGPNSVGGNSCPANSPILDASYAVDAIQVAGRWAWTRRANPWKLTGLTISGVHAATMTTLTLSNLIGTVFDIGSLLKIVSGTSIEYVLVTGPLAASASNGFATASIDVERGVNGSTALSLAGGETVSVWLMEPIIEWAAAEIVAAAYKSRDNAGGTAFNPGGIGTMTIADVPDKVLAKLVYPYFSPMRGVAVAR